MSQFVARILCYINFMDTIDFKKDPTYKAKPEPQLIKVPRMRFVMADGTGAPEAAGKAQTDFQSAMQALFGIVYTIKFWSKKYPTPPGYAPFTLAPIEALWSMKGGGSFDMSRPDDWQWTAMLRLPEFVTPAFFTKVVQECIRTKKSDVYTRARLEDFAEGTCVQLMHIGPYSAEGPNIQKLHDFAAAQDYVPAGRHHELYFGDPRRTAPEKLRTILRQPVTQR